MRYKRTVFARRHLSNVVYNAINYILACIINAAMYLYVHCKMHSKHDEVMVKKGDYVPVHFLKKISSNCFRVSSGLVTVCPMVRESIKIS